MILTDGEALAGGIGIITIFLGTIKIAYNEHQNNDNKTAEAVNKLSEKFDAFITDTNTRIAKVESSCGNNHDNIVSMDNRLACVERVTGIKPPLNNVSDLKG